LNTGALYIRLVCYLSVCILLLLLSAIRHRTPERRKEKIVNYLFYCLSVIFAIWAALAFLKSIFNTSETMIFFDSFLMMALILLVVVLIINIFFELRKI
jgi:FtsH-binding integral membrane protein